MYIKSRKTTCYFLYVILVFLSGCLPNQNRSGLSAFHDAHGQFRFEDKCISLNDTLSPSVGFSGTVWYDEENILNQNGRFGLHWSGNDAQDVGTIPVDPITMMISPDGKKAAFDGRKTGEPVGGGTVYLLEERNYQETKLKFLERNSVLTEDNIVMYASADWEKHTVSASTYNLKTGEVQKKDFVDISMSSEPLAQLSRSGLLAYDWYRNFDGPRLVLLDMKTAQEVGRYKDISYQIRPSWYGRIFNQQGTRILSISSLSGEGYDGKQQELFGVEIGKEPVQITDFHSKYPYALIYNINFGGQRWSPNNRWVVLNILSSETGQIDSSVGPSWLFLIDLEKNIAYRVCQQINPKDQHSITWSPNSRYFALSINDKIWVVDPKTLKSRLLVEKTSVPLRVLGWTIP